MNNFKRALKKKIEDGAAAIRDHSVSQKAKNGWTSSERRRYSITQYGFAVVWSGFLGAVGDTAINPTLRQAFKDNAACEIGMHGTSHVFLSRRFALTQGITPAELDKWPKSSLSQDSMSRMFSLLETDEAYNAGYLYAQEILAGVMFEAFLPAFKQVNGCDVTYMSVHIEVDGESHGPDILKGLEEILTAKTFPRILAGVEAAIEARIGYLEFIQKGQ